MEPMTGQEWHLACDRAWQTTAMALGASTGPVDAAWGIAAYARVSTSAVRPILDRSRPRPGPGPSTFLGRPSQTHGSGERR